MKILYISTACSKKKYDELYNMYKDKIRPSIENFHYSIMSGLSSNENDVTSLSGYQIPVSSGKKIFNFSFEEENNIRFVYPFIINCPVIRKMLTILCFSLYLIWWIIKNMFYQKRIIIDASFISVSPFMVFLASIFGIHITGIVADVYDYMSLKIESNDKRSFVKKITCHINNYCWKNYDSFVFLTEEMNKLLNVKKRPYIIMEGIYSVDEDDNDYKLNSKKKIIMYSGSLNKKYGIDKLIKAFKKIKLRNAELHLYGHTNMLDYINNATKEDKRIKYFGSVAIDEIRKREKEAYILVNPRPTHDEYTKYSFPSKTLEYMATGNIFITTKLSGIPDDYDEYVNYFTDETISGMSKGLEFLLDEKNYKKLKEKAECAKEYVLKNKNNIEQSKRIVNLDCDKNTKSAVYMMLLINFLLILIGFFAKSISVMRFSLIFSFIFILIDSLSLYNKRLIFLIFLFSYFIFSMGQYFFPNVTNDSLYYTNFDNQYVIRTFAIQYISLLLTYYGFLLFNRFKPKKMENFVIHKNVEKRTLSILFILMIITFITAILTVGESAIHTYKYGYLSYYDGSFTSVFPSIVKRISSYYSILFMIFLALCKDKKSIFAAFIMFFTYSLLTLIEGSRFNFVFAIIFTIFYVFHYMNINKIQFSKKVKKLFIPIVACVFIGIVGLSFYNKYRNNRVLVKIDPIYEFEAFFVSQGRSINLVTEGLIHEKELKKEKTYYVFGEFIQSFINKVNKIPYISINNISEKRKINYALDISLTVLGKNKVDQGHGLGSQYMAELYLDYGLIGVCIFSLMFGYILNMLSVYSKNNFIMRIFLFSSSISALQICRSSVWGFMSRFVSFTYWGFIVLIILLNHFYNKGREKKNENIVDC